jgi:hypothetical protein
MELMISGNNPIPQGLSNVYNESAAGLSDATVKLASGKNFQSAAEDLHGFTQKVNLEIDIRGLEDIRINLADAKTISSAAVDSGSTIYLSESKSYNPIIDRQMEFTDLIINGKGSVNL